MTYQLFFDHARVDGTYTIYPEFKYVYTDLLSPIYTGIGYWTYISNSAYHNNFNLGVL